jgi:hypothetical protein
MPVQKSAVVPQHPRIFSNHPQNPNIPQHQILILEWSALVVLYGVASLPPPSRTHRKNDGSIGC